MAVPGRKASSFRAIARGSEELHVLFCEPCNSDGHHLQADGYCVDCREYLCSTCIQYHGKVTATKKHVLLYKTNMPPNKQSTSTADICTDPCPYHKSKTIEYYCKTHDQLGCSACMTVNHRNCEDVDFILGIVDGIEDSPEYDDLVKKCTDLELDVKKIRNIANSNTSLVKAYVDEAFKHIREVKHEMNALFQELENQICEDVSVIGNEDSAVIRSVYEECDAVSSEIKDMTSDLDDKRRAKLGYHIFLAINKANTNVKLLQSKVNGIEKRNVIRQYSFEPAKLVTDMKQNLVELGMVLIVSPQDAATATGGKGPYIGSEAVSKKDRKTAPPVATDITQQKENAKAWRAYYTNKTYGGPS